MGFTRLALGADISCLSRSLLFPLRAFCKMFADPPHVVDRAILGFEDPGSRVTNGHRKLESIGRFVPKLAVPIEPKANRFALNQLLESLKRPHFLLKYSILLYYT